MNIKMHILSGFIFLLFTLNQSESGEILEDIANFKDNLFGGLFGKAKCGCACRDYYVPKCEITYVEQCRTEHYQQVCEQVPVPVPRQAKEIECQKCRKYFETVPIVKYVKECVPVYDEKCTTDYHQHCKTDTRCVMTYHTVCSPGLTTGYGYTKRNDGYGGEQHCQSQPREHCYPETKCHRTPDTQCIPVQKENCAKVPKEAYVQKERKECLPFELSEAEVEAMHQYDPCAQYKTGYGAPPPHAHGGYEAPAHHPHVEPQYAAPHVDPQYAPPHHDPHQGQFHDQHQHQNGPVFHEQQQQHSAQLVDQHHQPSSQQFRQSPVINNQQQQQPVIQQQQQSQSFFPALPTYNGPDPLFEIQEGLGQLFNTKRDARVLQKSPTVSENVEQIRPNNENPFLKGRRNVEFDGEGWIPLVSPYPLQRL